jgi:predicted nucleic acid-binding protein
MILYIEPSALVKRYVVEAGSTEVNILMEQAETVGASLLTRVEMASALAKAVRMKKVDAEKAKIAWRDFLSEWPSFTRLPVSPVLIERASQLAWEFGLRGYDATHFASAHTWQEILGMPITLASYDRELWLVANKVGMKVWPEVVS